MKTPFDDMDHVPESVSIQNVYYFTLYLIEEGGETGPQGHETIGNSQKEAEEITRQYFREHYGTEINITGCYNTTSQHAQM